MGNALRFKTFLFGAILLVFISCSKDETPDEAFYSQNDARRQIVQVVATSMATGFNSLFADVYTDSLARAGFCRDFTHSALYMDDESGDVFVESLSGYSIANPFHPEYEGLPSLENTDADGKKIVVEMIDIVTNTGYGFLEYNFANPASGLVEKKTAFVTLIAAADWYAGSGYYHTGDFPLLTDFDLNKMVVKEAVTAFAKGLGAIYETHVTDSMQGVELMRTMLKHIRFFDNRSGYFYVIDFRGYNVVQPPDPSIQGTYEWDIQDLRGNYLVRGLVETAQNGGGYYSYYWMDYTAQQEKLKTAYVEQIPGMDYLIGSGIYGAE